MGMVNLPENAHDWHFLLLYLFAGLILLLAAGLLLLKLYNDRLRKEVRGEKEFSKEVLDQTSILVWAVRPDRTTITFNKFAEKLTGLDRSEMIGKADWGAELDQTGFGFMASLMSDAMNHHFVNDWDASFTDRSGKPYYLVLRTLVIRDGEGQPKVFAVTGIDVTEQKSIEKRMKAGYNELELAYRELAVTETELQVQFDELTASREDLRVSEERLALAHEGSGAIIWEADLRTLEYYMSDRWYELMGYEHTGTNYPQQEVFDMIHPEDAEQAAKERQEHLDGKTPTYNTEYRMRTKNGDYRWFQVRGKALRNGQGRPYRFTGSLIDITDQKNYELRLRSSYQELEHTYGELAATQNELKKQYDLLVASRDMLRENEEKLHKMAYYDSLSGLPNRAFLLEELDRFVAGDGSWAALMFIDMDNFKSINDTFGHKHGDSIIMEAGNRLKTMLSPEIMVFRLGGNEFVVLVKEYMDKQQVFQMADRLIGSFKQPFMINQTQLHIVVSIGIAFYPEHAGNPDDLIKSADVALYHAQNTGNGSYCVYDASMQIELQNRMQIETQLLSALDHREFRLHYQPQIDAVSGRIVGFEALLRWTNPELGTVPPDKFIRIAEDNRQIIPIGEWVLQTACAFLKQVHHNGNPECTISVNISVIQLKQDRFVDSVLGILKKVALAPEFLEIEITESIFMESSDRTPLVAKLNQLRQLGIRVAIDDFGTGYSSLSYLQALPITTLKMDKQFIDQTETSDGGQALASTILLIGHSLGLQIVAEGVETEGQFVFLKQHNCDIIQGYLFSRPLPEAEVFKLLEGWKFQ